MALDNLIQIKAAVEALQASVGTLAAQLDTIAAQLDTDTMASSLITAMEENTEIRNRYLQIISNLTDPDLYLFPPQQILITPGVVSLNVRWETIETATSYIVTCKDLDGNTKIVTSFTNGVTISSLTPNTDYEVFVVTIRDAQQSAPSRHTLTTTLNS